MPGGFNKNALPKQPGAYINWVTELPTDVLPASGSIVATVITHDWGPTVPTLVESPAEFSAVFGNSDTVGSRAVRQAFVGEGLQSRGRLGASAVLVIRKGAVAIAQAVRTLNNTATTPALRLTARYAGTRGNNLRVTTQDHAADTTQNELIVLDGTVQVEKYVYADTDIAGLAATINAQSNWLVADGPGGGAIVTGTALAAVTSSALTGGNDGATLTATEWTDAMTALSAERFGIFVPYDLTDSSILASLKTWVQNENAAGHRFMAVVGGAAGESISQAVARAASLNDPNFVTIGVGSVNDVLFVGSTDAPVPLSTSQLAPRIAGILAQRGEHSAITLARVLGVEIVNGASSSDLDKAYDGGVVCLQRNSSAEAPVGLSKGLTTYTTTNDPARPYTIYRNPKFVRTIHGIQNELQEYAESIDSPIGLEPVDDITVKALEGEVHARLQSRQDARIIQPGWGVAQDLDPPPSVLDEFVALKVTGFTFSRTVEQIFLTLVAG